MRTRLLVITGVVVVVLVAAGLGAAWYFGKIFTNPSVKAGPPVAVPTTAVQTLSTHLEAPWGIAFLPDRSALVTERNSKRVLSVKPDGTVTEVTRIDEAAPGGEGGLLGIAVSPRYDSDKYVYVYYTTTRDNRIARLRLGSSGESPQVIFSGIPKAGNHDGGRLAFGPDGLLYVGTGDAGDRDRAQDRSFLGGKILRLNPDGTPAAGNPFGTAIYSYGHRNVQGLAWDSSGQLYAAEFGQNRYDELNRIQAGGNYGWPVVEGTGNDSRYVDPVATWATSDASPSGIAILDNRVYIACLRGTKLYRVGTDGTGAQALLSGEYGRLRAVAVAPDRSLWILTSNRDGRGSPTDEDDRIIRLDPTQV